MGQLAGKVAIVTGASTGIGLASAKRFADEGAHVYLMSRRQAELDAAVKTVGSTATGVRGDISNLADLDRLFATVRADGRRIDVLFANAGLGEFARLEEVTEKHFDWTFGVNVRGMLFTVQKALPLLNDGASVILPGSTAASNGQEAFGVYAASKAAVRSFARTWANELKTRNIRVNALAAGPTETPGVVSGLATAEMPSEALKQALASAVPLGRMAHPDEQAAAALFLASAQSSFVTGIELLVDGGMNQI